MFKAFKRRSLLPVFIALIGTLGIHAHAVNEESGLYWLKAKASNKFERSRLAADGHSVETYGDDYVIILGSAEEKEKLEKSGTLISGFKINSEVFDFPEKDSVFHNYSELTQDLQALARDYADIMALDSIGNSLEGREIHRIRISKDIATAAEKPGIVFMGGHHAREHISIEIPYLLTKHLLEQYRAGDAEIVRLIDSRDIHIIPMVNPDGAEYDIESGRYRNWRKNRATNEDGTRGVDLNRNYGYMWGTGGSSSNPSRDTYMGTRPFSEPETQAIKAFIEANTNISILLTFHTFSELILYPWGHTYDPIANERDRQTYLKMAQTMAEWNGYKPQASSDLYITSGDTVDWAYGEHKIFGFTFELDPRSIWKGGFYPGAQIIPTVFNKNLKPCLYLIDLADNPYRATDPQPARYGLNTMLLEPSQPRRQD